MNYSISNTAEYGEYVQRPAHHNRRDQGRDEARYARRHSVGQVHTRDWMLENKVNQTSFKAMRARANAHPIEEVGEKLRAMMPWIGKNKLVDKAKN